MVSVTYFFRGDGASVIWDPKENKVLCACDGNGVFALTRKEPIRVLEQMGYKKMDEEQLADIGITELPNPDLLDHPPRQRFVQG